MRAALTNDDARISCSALIADYAYLVDHRQFARAVELFSPDGRIERPDLVSNGPGEILAHWMSRPATVVTCHVCSPPSFRELAGDSAMAVTYFTLYHLTHDGDGTPPMNDPVALGEFHDSFVLTELGWRFKTRVVRAALKRS
ncbi:nuclear transport factor 2 family protein [Sphingobium ummariense]